MIAIKFYDDQLVIKETRIIPCLPDRKETSVAERGFHYVEKVIDRGNCSDILVSRYYLAQSIVAEISWIGVPNSFFEVID